ncbi:GSCOCG00010635001-RA-CDS [Cotesia congregata]|nr:GSCOCG00010635001-RA-CDS [Cotesia congregata]
MSQISLIIINNTQISLIIIFCLYFDGDAHSRYMYVLPIRVEMIHTYVPNVSVDMEQEYNFDSNDCNSSFNEVIGHIEDILIETDFQKTQQHILEKYWREFDSGEENKLIYMIIFEEYHKTIENYIETNLKKIIPKFSMEMLFKQLSDNSSKLEGEVFDILYALTDFLAFKEMILDYKAVKEGKVQDLSTGITITPLKLKSSSNLKS